MKRKKTYFILILIFIIGACLCIYSCYNKTNLREEYIPEEEISEEQMRQTIITLYFKNKETGDLMKEERKKDANILTVEPYKKVIEMLIEGPKNENLERLIPKETKINAIEIKSGIIYIDFSNEFIDNNKEKKKNQNEVVYSIINSLANFNEIEGIKILIDGKENENFREEGIDFKTIFTPTI